MFTIQEDNAVLLAELNARIRGYEENMREIKLQIEQKEREYDEVYQKMIYTDEQLYHAE